MERIAFIIPYFGQFNDYFPLWLQSCKHNKAIADFYVFTDIKCPMSIPENVKFIPITFDILKEKIQTLYDFPISLNQPYDFCDFKPAYGDIFHEYITEYSHWAFGDNDLIWGDWETMLPLNWKSYERIGKFGHLTIIQNSEKMRLLYRFNDAYRIAFQAPFNTFFDEKAFNRICKINGIKINPLKIADCNPRKLRIQLQDQTYDHNSGLFVYENGHLYQLYMRKNTICKEEFTYMHFLKRKMKLRIENSYAMNRVYIYQTNIDNNLGVSINKELLSHYSQEQFYWSYWLKYLNPKTLFNSLYYKFDHRRKHIMQTIDNALTNGF